MKMVNKASKGALILSLRFYKFRLLKIKNFNFHINNFNRQGI